MIKMRSVICTVCAELILKVRFKPMFGQKAKMQIATKYVKSEQDRNVI
jgi:hypothetical protein